MMTNLSPTEPSECRSVHLDHYKKLVLLEILELESVRGFSETVLFLENDCLTF